MSIRIKARAAAFAFLLVGWEPVGDTHVAHAAQANVSQALDWTRVDHAMEREGMLQEGGVRRYSMPRSDLHVTSRGVRIQPAFALGSWVAMTASGPDEVVVMGDLVLTEEELGPVLSILREGGIGPSAIHQHLFDHDPPVWWAHVHAHGEPTALANTLSLALELTGTPPGGNPAAQLESPVDTAEVRAILGHSGRVNGGVFAVNVPRSETIRSMGIEVPPAMGLSTAINFQAAGGAEVAIAGDFVLTVDEVDPVASALLDHGIEVVSIHNHLLDEEPRLAFMHFWATGDAADLSRGLRAALDVTSSFQAAEAVRGAGSR
jgi:hypothetical protein